MIDLMLGAIAPHICYGCGFVGSPFCDSCMNDITEEDFGRCVWCMKPTSGDHQCRVCARRVSVQGAWTAGVRDRILLRVVDGYKFESCRGAAAPLTSLLDAVLPVFDDRLVVSWVPTAPAHIRERGFDHAALLARTFAKRRGYRARPLLVRTGSLTQHTLGKREREQAAREAFRIRPEARTVRTPVLLVDDILTTGATLRACVRELRAHDIDDVYIAVVCRQPDGAT